MGKKSKCYEGGGEIQFETKMGENEAINKLDGIRARAMKSVEGLEGIKGSDIEDETGAVKGSIKRNEYGDLYDSAMKASAPKKTAPKSVMKTSMNDMPDKLRAPDYKAPSMVKTVTKEVTKMSPRSPGRMLREESEYTMKPSLQSKGERLMKSMGLNFKSGGKVSSASKRADGCAIRGKTRA
jgi:hypothetical protein